MTLRSTLNEFRLRHDLPAVGGGVITVDGELEFAVVGNCVSNGDDPVRNDDSWHIGSCAKAMTAMLCARLVERDLVRWDTPVPELFDDLQLHDGWGEVTLEDLLVHRAGVAPNLERGDMLAAWRSKEPLADQRTAATATALAPAPSQPGEPVYSNLGFIIVGAAIDRLADTTFEEAMAAEVFEPLDITSAGWGAPSRVRGHRSRRVRVIPGRSSSKAVNPASHASDNPPVMNSAGRVHLNVRDWSKFLRLYLGTRETIVRRETIDRMLTAGPDRMDAMGWVPTDDNDDVSYGQQGSNTLWTASALLSADCSRAAFTVWNDGRIDPGGEAMKLTIGIFEQ